MTDRPRRPARRVAGGVAALVAIAVGVIGCGTSPDRTATADPPRKAVASRTSTAAPQGMPSVEPVSGLPYVDLHALPPEAADTVHLIDSGGPFPYEEDGSTFGNYEGLLPDEPEGYYKEYTVETPGSPDRGARRIVGGGDGRLYWTADHYASFEVIWRAAP